MQSGVLKISKDFHYLHQAWRCRTAEAASTLNSSELHDIFASLSLMPHDAVGDYDRHLWSARLTRDLACGLLGRLSYALIRPSDQAAEATKRSRRKFLA